MIWGFVLALVLLWAVNWFVRRSTLYPPAYFAAAWVGFLLLVAISGDLFYPISNETQTFYLLCALAFSVGGFSYVLLSDGRLNGKDVTTNSFESTRAIRRRVLDVLLVCVIISIPLYYRWLKHLVGATEDNFLTAVRTQLLVYDDTEGLSKFNLLDNFVWLSVPLTLLMAMENDGTRGRKLRVWIAALSGLVLNILTGGRAGAINLLVALFGLDWLRERRLNWKVLGAVFVAFVLVFSLIAIALEKGNTRRDASLAENFPTIIEGFQFYAVGGVVGFDRVYQHPTDIPASWDLARPFGRLANKLGYRVDTTPIHAAYVSIGPGKADNVYTMYFAYLPVFGATGTLLAMVALGFLVTALYCGARCGIPEAMMLFALCFAGLTLSGFNENFLLAINPITKTLLLTAALYRWDVVKRVVPKLSPTA